MRILSKFKDYYDSGLAYGMDEKVIFERKTERLKLSVSAEARGEISTGEYITKLFPLLFVDITFPNRRFVPERGRVITHKDKKFTLTPIGVCLAGKTYYGIEVAEGANGATSLRTKKTFHYDFDSLLGAVPFTPSSVDTIFDSFFSKRSLRKFFDSHPENKELVLQRKHPIVYYRGEEHAYINPVLKDIGFGKAVLPHEAFQELSMFIAAVNDTEEVVDIGDQHMAAQKGFDCYSFKTEPTKRERKACRKLK